MKNIRSWLIPPVFDESEKKWLRQFDDDAVTWKMYYEAARDFTSHTQTSAKTLKWIPFHSVFDLSIWVGAISNGQWALCVHSALCVCVNRPTALVSSPMCRNILSMARVQIVVGVKYFRHSIYAALHWMDGGVFIMWCLISDQSIQCEPMEDTNKKIVELKKNDTIVTGSADGVPNQRER